MASVLGTAILGDPIRAYEIPEYAHRFVNDSDRDAHASWAWPLSDIQPLGVPAPARGAQGFWTWAGEVMAGADVADPWRGRESTA